MYIEGTITKRARPLNVSAMGNPTYVVTVDDKPHRTVTDGQVGYMATNFHIGDRVRLTMTGRSLQFISNIEKI